MDISYNSLDFGQGCHKCSRQVSSVEKLVLAIVQKEFFPDAIGTARHLLPERPRMSFDIFVPSQRIAIEIDGVKWHSSQLAQKRDLAKNELCVKNNIRLLRIPLEYPERGRLRVDAFLEKARSAITRAKKELIWVGAGGPSSGGQAPETKEGELPDALHHPALEE